MKELVEPAGQEKGGTRNKDRMSYSHQAYQIDLTQVTPADVRVLTPLPTRFSVSDMLNIVKACPKVRKRT